MKRTQYGVTLMELMIVVAVVAILGAVAFPSYQTHVMESGRAEAWSNLLRMSEDQERYYIQNNAYATTAQLGYVATESAPVYTYTVTLGTPANGFTARATAVGGQAGDTECATITLTNGGVRGGTSGGACW